MTLSIALILILAALILMGGACFLLWIKMSGLVNQQLTLVTTQMREQMNMLSQSLQNSAGQIHVRLENSSKAIQDVSHKLGSLSSATEKLFEMSKNITALEEILKPPKMRGGMGEILLENVLREILPSENFFSFQHAFKSGETVDAVIRLKEGLIPIDAKFPLEHFRRLVDSKEEKERDNLRKEFVRNIKKHIEAIASKYIRPEEGTFNFGLMYIPAENIYYETILRDHDSDLFAFSTKKHVFPVSPNSIYAYLMTLALGLRGLKVEEQTKEILAELGRLDGELNKFSKDFKVMGSHLSDAGKKFNEADKRLDKLEGRMVSLRSGSPSLEPPVESPPPLELKGEIQS